MDNTISMTKKPFYYHMHKIGYGLVEYIFPQKRSCMFCGRHWQGSRLNAELCYLCLEQWRRYRRETEICPRCGSFDSGDPCQGPCAESTGGYACSLEAICAAAPYTGVYRQRIMALKYNGLTKLAKPMGYMMAEAWEAQGAWASSEAVRTSQPSRSSPVKPLLVPVPLHPDKERSRGYNQSRLLAQSISWETGFPVADLLCRLRPGHVQAELGRQQRMHALDQVFAWASGTNAPAPLDPPSQPRPAIIVDDVVTTGATLEACGQILRTQGYWPVWGLTFVGGVGQIARK